MDSPIYSKRQGLMNRVINFFLVLAFFVSSMEMTTAFRHQSSIISTVNSRRGLRFHQAQRDNKMATLEYSKERSWGQKPSKIDLLFDSECPICRMEVEFLRKRDIYNKIKFTDLQSPDYDPKEHGDVTFEKGMRKLRAVLPDKTVVTGVEVFRRTYDAIGLGWVFAFTQLPILGKLADAAYDVWAENRLRITGRGDLADVVRMKAEELRELGPVDECDLDACAIEWDD